MKRIIASLMLLLTSIGYTQSNTNPEKDKIKNARKLAKKFFKKQHIPGMSISVSEKGELIWSEGFGYASRKPKVKIKPDETLFRIASISKSITAVALAKMMDEKRIDIDKSIYKYLPKYPKKKYDFTVKELGGHLAGIRSYKGNEYVLNEKMSISESLKLFKNDALLFEPSTKFSYNTFGYVLLSEIMQKASNTDFNTLFKKYVYKHLKMTHTELDNSTAEIPNRTNFYRAKRILSTQVANEHKVGGGGFLSTSEDITKFGHELISPHIISKTSLSKITTSQKLKSGNKTGYGIGFSVEKTSKGTPKFYHTGGGVGASTILMIFPEEDIVITVLTNLTGVKMDAFGDELQAVFLEEEGEAGKLEVGRMKTED